MRHQLSSAVLAAELRAIYTEHRAAPALEQGLLLLCTRLATELARTLPTPMDGGTAPVAVAGEELVVPTSSMRLLPSSQVFIDDAPWHSSDAPAQALTLTRSLTPTPTPNPTPNPNLTSNPKPNPVNSAWE